jgi:membrane protease subunit HflC
MQKFIKIFAIVAVVALVVLFSSKFIVKQGSESVVLRLGELVKGESGTVTEFKPGIHAKIPFVDSIKTYDMRNRVLTTDSSRVVTKEKKDVLINAYVVWRIDNISKFFTSTSGQVDRAELLLKQYLESSLRAEVGKNDIQSLVNNNRDKLMIALTHDVEIQAKGIGIHVVDVRVNQIDLPETITESIYQRMKSSRHKEAAKIRAEGDRGAEKKKATADATVTVMMAQADKDSKTIKAEADAKAAKIFSDTYSASVPLYQFLKSMNSYKESFDGKNQVVFMLKPDSRFFEGFTLDNNSKLAEDMRKAK